MLDKQDVRFAFGENWASFSKAISEEKIADAVVGLNRIFPAGLAGKSFLDIGCGSGLSMLAALRLGAAKVAGIDIDPASAATATSVLKLYAPESNWSVECRSVFDLSASDGLYAAVNSWGVLHHTGDMWGAINIATGLVEPKGQIGIAIYRKTMLCPAWKIEKRLYAKASKPVQTAAKTLFKTAVLGAQKLTSRNAGRSPDRGMDFDHDIHDWLGGYPYESATPDEITGYLNGKGFSVRIVGNNRTDFINRLGIFGSGCVEYAGIRNSPRQD